MLARLLLLACLCAAGARAAAADQTHRSAGKVFGTTVEVSIHGEPAARAAQLSALVFKEFERLHGKFHAWQPSQLTALNAAIARGDSYHGDAEMVDLLKAAAALAARADNTFNPAIGGLIRLWGFQTSDIRPVSPSAAEIRRWVEANPRMSDLDFDGVRISSRNKAVMLDLGGYAKGYALDRAAALLRAQHVKAALINIGGNVLAIGQPGARPWRVGVQDPRGAGLLASVALRDNEAIGTSGDYQRYFMKDGKRRPHIIDPRSGQSVDRIASVTIITSGGADAGTRSDGLTKPLFLTGADGWQAMAARLGLEEVLLVDTERNVMLTPAMQARIDAR